MNFIDIIILVVVVLVIGSIIYFNFIKRSYSPCKSCPKYKACKSKESLIEYYHRECVENRKESD